MYTANLHLGNNNNNKNKCREAQNMLNKAGSMSNQQIFKKETISSNSKNNSNTNFHLALFDPSNLKYT